MAERVTIARLGAKADGIAGVEGGQAFVPYALPGETVTGRMDLFIACWTSAVLSPRL